MLLKTLLCISFLFASTFIFGQNETQINNLKTFSKLYGYVKYFHPSDEAAGINWDRFAIYGCGEVEKCSTQQELRETLLRLFRPVAPTIKIYSDGEQVKFELSEITPANPSKYKVVAWQHLGVYLGADNNYRSARTNRPETIRKGPDTILQNHALLFKKYPLPGEHINKSIGSGLFCMLPLALYGNNTSTFPVADTSAYAGLKNRLNEIAKTSLTAENRQLRLADIIITWNVMQHFFPYFKFAGTNWEDDLPLALIESYPEQSAREYANTLRKFTAKLKDGHVFVNGPATINEYNLLPLAWEWVQDSLIITRVLSDNLSIDRGDIVTHINGVAAKDFFAEAELYISAATKSSMKHKAENRTLTGWLYPQTVLNIVKSNGKKQDVKVSRTLLPDAYYLLAENSEKTKQIADSIYYINFDKASWQEISTIMPELYRSKAIICDMRGYPNDNDQFIKNLLHRKDTSRRWMQDPHIIYPDQENIAGYTTGGWYLRPARPYLNAKIIFITDGRAISYAESFMSFIENYKLATIIGQPTAGTNGGVNRLVLPGGYSISFTGELVVKHDGSQHHGIGILPNIYVEKTIKGIREGRDEFLEKAIQIANE